MLVRSAPYESPPPPRETAMKLRHVLRDATLRLVGSFAECADAHLHRIIQN